MIPDTSETSDHPVVRFDVRDGLGILTIDNPPVNAGSTAVRAGLLSGLAEAARHAIEGIVILGAGRSFIAGSDIREFGAPLAAPELPQVIAAIEDSPHVVCAAIHGAALGGGFELALGCDLRIAAPDAVMGLPEVTLGMVPGRGGTQRLPRLTGVAEAMSLVCSGRRVAAPEALGLGVIDAIAKDDGADALIAAARAAIRAAPVKRRLRDLPVPMADPDALQAAGGRRAAPGQGPPERGRGDPAGEALGRAAGAQEALLAERAAFQKLRPQDEAFALRHLFFAERAAARIDGLDAAPAAVARVGLVGGGTMGQGSAARCWPLGCPSRWSNATDPPATRLRAPSCRRWRTSVAKGRLEAGAAARRKALLTASDRMGDLADCDLVIEAVFEDMGVKQALFAALDDIVKPGAILATNTSYLDIDDMAAATRRRSDVVGLHFFSPADVMPLLEVVRAQHSSDRALATALAVAKRLGKQAVVARVAEGFIGNRIYAAYRRHAEFLLEEGASPEAVDSAATGFGFAMGPFAVGDMSGLDIAWMMRKRQAATRDPRTRYVDIPDRLCEAGRFGRKTGGGYYDYSAGRAQPSDVVAGILAEARAAKGIVPRSFTPREIEDRLLGAIVNEAALVLAEGVAQRPGDIDVTLVHGYGFPRWTGGPLCWASGQPPARIAGMGEAVAQAVGKGHLPGAVEDMLAPFRAARAEIEQRKSGDA